MLAGLRRQRVNAVNYDTLKNEHVEYTQKTGRPSKGGDLLRAKRYYAKNQMLNLRKGKMRRYHQKVKEIISKYNYKSSAVKEVLDQNCIMYHSTTILENSLTKNYLLYALDYAREDGYLSFLNEESQRLVKANSTQKFDKNNVQLVLQNLASMHFRRFYQLTVLWSAYVLLSYAENEIEQENIMNDVVKIEKIKEKCLECYTLELGHLTNNSEDGMMLLTEGRLNKTSYIKKESDVKVPLNKEQNSTEEGDNEEEEEEADQEEDLKSIQGIKAEEDTEEDEESSEEDGNDFRVMKAEQDDDSDSAEQKEKLHSDCASKINGVNSENEEEEVEEQQEEEEEEEVKIPFKEHHNKQRRSSLNSKERGIFLEGEAKVKSENDHNTAAASDEEEEEQENVVVELKAPAFKKRPHKQLKKKHRSNLEKRFKKPRKHSISL